ncbi:hypothetical protein [Pontibacter harenae]|uniref:hypothetical protein n=1 Tax=Pontibacter harenae TaxID=2894083 RepID=UPI001E5E709D|nr:hypothetical protein [Pontibacter harenae]MCC9167359.1 hypothetical protein [Pontibacter harenae]
MLPDDYADIVIYNRNFELHKGGKVVAKPFTYTVAQLEQELRLSPCSGQRLTSDAQVENALMPPLVISFYEFVFEHSTLPTDKELVQYYIAYYYKPVSQNPSLVKIKPAYAACGSSRELSVVGVKNRLLRMYPSLVRDLHFMMLCHESGSFSDVYYSVKQDYALGYDLVVKRNNVKVYVRLMVETKRSQEYNSKKFTRHDMSQKNIFELKIRLSPERKLGEFFLYNKQDLLKLVQHIDANAAPAQPGTV